MLRTCGACKASFSIDDDDRAFLDRVSPVIDGKKFLIPSPTLCPDCRQQRRTAQNNEFNLYPGICGLCNKRVVTEHPPHAEQLIYCRQCWNSDRWDVTEYGREFDFSRPFFEQFLKLRRSTPLIALNQTGTIENSDYIHYAGFSKNCYLIMHADYCEDCCYGYGFKKNRSCFDGFYNLHCELCYDSVYVHKSYGLVGCQDCVNCSGSAFLKDCIGCKNCFLSTSLRNKEYVYENEQLTKEEYELRMHAVDLGSHGQYEACRARLRDLVSRSIVRAYEGRNIENCTGNYLQNCKNCDQCFDMEDGEDCKYCYQLVLGAKNSRDIYQYGTMIDECYECGIVGDNSYHILFSSEVFINCADLLYCIFMEAGSHHCFGCCSMKGGSYRILNRQYSKEEYEEMIPRIIAHMQKTGEWGEFFPITTSLFGYNKTTAMLWYPLSRDEVIAKGWQYDEAPDDMPSVLKVIDAGALPDNIRDVPDDILNWAVTCEVTRRPFKITPQELRFYRERSLPIPRRSPYQRHLDRFARRNPRRFWERKCAKCQKSLQTTYAPDRSETVLCDVCYSKAVY